MDLYQVIFKVYEYSQTSVFEHNSFWNAVQKPICSKTESYFPITNYGKEINLFHVIKRITYLLAYTILCI